MSGAGEPNSASLHGSCLCGRVRFQLCGDIGGFYICHCQHCQKDTGSAFASNLFVDALEFSWEQGSEHVRTFQLPDTLHHRSFCDTCGSAVPTRNSRQVVVPAGCLDRPLVQQPTAHIYTASRAAWEGLLPLAPDFAELPSQTEVTKPDADR